MNIHVVQPGDTIDSIADQYKMSVTRLIQDNGLINPNSLVIGQTIVIAYPEKTYTVQEGDSLKGIADKNGVSMMQILRNNPFLSDREYIYPGETIVISYQTESKTETDGYALAYISDDILKKTLPYLTYLTVFNYSITNEDKIITYGDDTRIIQTAKDYGSIPLMMVTTLAIRGEPNIETAFEILLNEAKQEININNILEVLRSKGYSGVNIIYYYLNTTTQQLYINFTKKISERLKKEGYLIFITVNINLSNIGNDTVIEKVDYNSIGQLVDKMTFMNFIFGTNYGPPLPVSSNYYMKSFLDYAIPLVQAEKVNISSLLIGYDWQLPYTAGSSRASSLTPNAAISLAHDVNAAIDFDEKSQTPYYYYFVFSFGSPDQHIVWFEDARTINSLSKLISEYALSGSGVWNVMFYTAQLWLVINSQFEIIKKIPDIID